MYETEVSMKMLMGHRVVVGCLLLSDLHILEKIYRSTDYFQNFQFPRGILLHVVNGNILGAVVFALYNPS